MMKKRRLGRRFPPPQPPPSLPGQSTFGQTGGGATANTARQTPKQSKRQRNSPKSSGKSDSQSESSDSKSSKPTRRSTIADSDGLEMLSEQELETLLEHRKEFLEHLDINDIPNGSAAESAPTPGVAAQPYVNGDASATKKRRLEVCPIMSNSESLPAVADALCSTEAVLIDPVNSKDNSSKSNSHQPSDQEDEEAGWSDCTSEEDEVDIDAAGLLDAAIDNASSVNAVESSITDVPVPNTPDNSCRDQSMNSSKADTATSSEAIVRKKTVLKYRHRDYFEVLPDGWIEIVHNSGIPVYLHRSTRVCTLSRPYILGASSVRRHDIPVSSIPCLHQQEISKFMEEHKERVSKLTQNSVDEPAADPSDPELSKPKALPSVMVDDLKSFAHRSLTAPELHEYCQKNNRFQFEVAQIRRFPNWRQHRSYHKEQRQRANRASLPGNVKLVTVSHRGPPGVDQNGLETQSKSKPVKQFHLNPYGKTSVAVLHEYVQRALSGSPEYEYMQTDSASMPYSATVKLNGVRYATGYGNNKKNAKLDAATKTLRVLIPDFEFDSTNHTASLPNECDIFNFFDSLTITNDKIFEFSDKSGQPTPFNVLQECLRRNHALDSDNRLDTNIEPKGHQQHLFTMRFGEYEVKVPCTNKSEGKHQASQHLLQQLHPQISTWGGLLRLYGYGSSGLPLKFNKLKQTGKATDQQSGAQSSDQPQPPNRIIIDRLRRDMLRLYQTSVPKESGSGCAEAENENAPAVEMQVETRENERIAQAIKHCTLPRG